MDESFFERPILNSPYAFPARHWELDSDGKRPIASLHQPVDAVHLLFAGRADEQPLVANRVM
jgi:hypothetical protein